jgi:hypothetical protein
MIIATSEESETAGNISYLMAIEIIGKRLANWDAISFVESCHRQNRIETETRVRLRNFEQASKNQLPNRNRL